MKGMLLFALAALAAAAPPPGVSDLRWLEGTWSTESKGRWTEEAWTAPRGGLMMGVNRSGKGEKADNFEFLRIAGEPGLVIYWASPGGKTAVPFRLISAKAGEAVFENPANAYPVRIVYRRKGDTLIATVSGKEGRNPLSWSFTRKP
jgi:hypothetical protein